MKKYRNLLFALMNILFVFISGCSTRNNKDDRSFDAAGAPIIQGELRQWNKVTLLLEGPEMIESPSTFRDYRLDVTFSQGNRQFRIPGHFAADANAAISGAEKGKYWRVYFTPNATGEWKYNISFRKGKDVAVGLNPKPGEPVKPFDRMTGTFSIAPSDKSPSDFRKKGLLQYAGEHYQRFAGDGTCWLAVGTGSPENLLGGSDFDAISVGEQWITDHIQDWKQGDPTWRDGKGKGVIGAVNYMADRGMNTLWLALMNAYCDAARTSTEAYPWPSKEMTVDNLSTFDVSKLDQWEMVMEYAQNRGMALHIILGEEEAEGLWEKAEGLEVGGETSFADTRKLYYREVVSRFGYFNALDWNMGEEFGWDLGGEKQAAFGGWPPISNSQKKLFVDYVTAVDAYGHPRCWEGPLDQPMYDYAPWFSGTEFNRTAIQGATPFANEYSVMLRMASKAAGHPWVIYFSEHHDPTLSLRTLKPEYFPQFRQSVWGTFLGGGAGMEWYLEADDYFLKSLRPYEQVLIWSAIVHGFMHQYLPFWEMEPCNYMLRPRTHGYCFAKRGEIYAIYLSKTEKTTLNLGYDKGSFEVGWFNPREGGPLVSGTVKMVKGGAHYQNLGQPPSEINEDWVILVRKTQEN